MNIKRAVSLILAILTVALLTAACGFTDDESSETKTQETTGNPLVTSAPSETLEQITDVKETETEKQTVTDKETEPQTEKQTET